MIIKVGLKSSMIDDVIYGLRAELAASSEFEEFVIRRVEQDGSVRKVILKLEDGDGRLDGGTGADSMVGGAGNDMLRVAQ